jgi:hypothetical protein
MASLDPAARQAFRVKDDAPVITDLSRRSSAIFRNACSP